MWILPTICNEHTNTVHSPHNIKSIEIHFPLIFSTRFLPVFPLYPSLSQSLSICSLSLSYPVYLYLSLLSLSHLPLHSEMGWCVLTIRWVCTLRSALIYAWYVCIGCSALYQKHTNYANSLCECKIMFVSIKIYDGIFISISIVDCIRAHSQYSTAQRTHTLD